MISYKKLFIFLILLFNIINPTYAADKTSFIDIDYVIKNSNIGKKTLENINKIDKNNIDLLDKRNKDLKKIETEIKNKKNIISEDEFNKEVKAFQNKIKDYNKEKNKIVNEFNKFRNEELEKVFKKINPVISNYMKENSINILFDSKNIFMGNPKVNLTEDILKKVNDELE